MSKRKKNHAPVVKLPKEFQLTIKVFPNPDYYPGNEAHCLEMDLQGFGETPLEALKECFSCILTQIECAKTVDQVFFSFQGSSDNGSVGDK